VATVELQFGALPQHARTARLIAAALARRVGVEESLIDEVKLAVGEACSRAVDVHRQHDPTELVTVRFDDSDDVFSISVLDAGPPMEQVADGADGSRRTIGELLDQAGADDPEDDATLQLPSGLGLALIEGLVDDVTISARTDGPGTSVTMSWPRLDELLLPAEDDDTFADEL
jgi:anti-sigma regulatory factor (Ser/Thr protein kinase)